jgi:CO/xanthine dehydrogenase FAD-binding subunit
MESAGGEVGARGTAMQVPAPFEYERATSVDHAIALMERLGSEARIVAGGHSLLPLLIDSNSCVFTIYDLGKE